MRPVHQKLRIKCVIRTCAKPEKAQQWYFGMKIYIGADVNSSALLAVTSTVAHVADIAELSKLLRDSDRVIFVDVGYTRDECWRGARHLGLRWCVNDRRKPGKSLSSSQKKRNRKQSSVRVHLERIFLIIKQQFSFQKTRYRGLGGGHLLVGLANLYLLRRQLKAV